MNERVTTQDKLELIAEHFWDTGQQADYQTIQEAIIAIDEGVALLVSARAMIKDLMRSIPSDKGGHHE